MVKKVQAPPRSQALATRRQRALAVGALLGDVVAPAVSKKGALLAQLLPHWHAICPLLADHCAPEALQHDVLVVACASDAVKQELHYMSPQLVQAVNLMAGYAAIAKVRGITRTFTPKNRTATVTKNAQAVAAVDDSVRQMCQRVRDDGLRTALEKLGARLKAKK